ncbi:MAG: OmpA family protein [Muribaculaceae bacterium]|nr:OmpA family protein [Bacteroides sp.]MDE5845975.1 OmpA family protein [Muribaculaceae bacterium]MDE6194983.1 OmpA family protein [Muribaculaceae bacterium]
MKKTLLAAAVLTAGAATTMAQESLQKPGFFDNISIGVQGGATTPLSHGSKFFKDMRGAAGLDIRKQITPAFGVGIEGDAAVNTSSWKGQTHSTTAFDASYVGAYGAVNLFKLFQPYGTQNVFDIEAVAGAGWGHNYQNGKGNDHNFFGTKAGLNFNFNVSDAVTLSLRPSVLWDMSDAGVSQTSAAYNVEKATFNIAAGVSVRLGQGFKYTVPNYNLDEIAALNAKVDNLRADLAAAGDALNASQNENMALANELQRLKNQKPVVVKETQDFLSTVRYVNFGLGKYNVPADQLPNVAAVASYLKNHPKATVNIKGYASQDGPIEVNERLANQRAESVKNMLVKKYGIPADRIKAEGLGVGHMFEEESWNRVAVCILDNDVPVSTETTVRK